MLSFGYTGITLKVSETSSIPVLLMKQRFGKACSLRKKDVVLVAPWLGYRDLSSGSIGLGKLGEGKGCQLYLEEVLSALSDFHGVKNLQINTLVIAGHSAGGLMMRDVIGALGGLKQNLKECWGFDCIYGPASTWSEWIRTNKTKAKLYFYIANGSNKISAVDLIKKSQWHTKKNQSSTRVVKIYLWPPR